MRNFALFACLSLVIPFAMAADVTVSNAWIRELPAGAPSAGYFDLRNTGNAKVQLVGAKSPAFGQVTLHQTLRESDHSRMVAVQNITVPPGSTVAFKPGGYHLMLMKPQRDFLVGSKVPITFVFANGEQIDAQFEVRGPAGHAH